MEAVFPTSVSIYSGKVCGYCDLHSERHIMRRRLCFSAAAGSDACTGSRPGVDWPNTNCNSNHIPLMRKRLITCLCYISSV